MPLKIRQLKSMLSRAGFVVRPGKGSHSVWKHYAFPDLRVTLSGSDGDDAELYQEKLVQDALKRLGGKHE